MRTFKMFLFATAIACFASGCSDSDSNDNPNPGNSKAAVDVQMTEAALTAADVPAVNADDAKDWGENLNEFGFDFMHKLGENSNLVFSPFSLHSALSMTACGAGGDTLKEMAEVLNVSEDVNEIAKENGTMRLNLRYDGQTEGSKFEIANRIWVDQTAEVVPTFKTLMNDHFKAPLQIVDFINYASDVVDVINEWVSNVTNKMIQDLLSPTDVNANTKMILVNAIHFDGEWKYKFEKENTRDSDFLVNGKDAKTVQMMSQAAYVSYYENNDYKAIVLPYKGDKFSMIFILPNENDGLPKVAANLGQGDIAQIVSESTQNESIIVVLPKFKIESNVANAADILNAQGIKLALSESADFSQMISNTSVFINKVIHKAVIEVDEEGTKAAAATAIAAEDGKAGGDKVFRADHPFAFALIHNASNGILFAGQYVGE